MGVSLPVEPLTRVSSKECNIPLGGWGGQWALSDRVQGVILCEEAPISMEISSRVGRGMIRTRQQVGPGPAGRASEQVPVSVGNGVKGGETEVEVKVRGLGMPGEGGEQVATWPMPCD